MRLRTPTRPPYSYTPPGLVELATSAYTLQSSDRGNVIHVAGACGITVPPLVFVAGDELVFLQTAAGSVTFTAGSGMTLNVQSGLATGLAIPGQWHFVVLHFVSATSAVLRHSPLVGAAGGGGPVATTVVFDTATGASANNVNGRTPDTTNLQSVTWVVPTGGQVGEALSVNGAGAFVRSNASPTTANAAATVTYTTYSHIKITATLDIAGDTTVPAGIIYDFTDNNNFTWIQILGTSVQRRKFVAAVGTTDLTTTIPSITTPVLSVETSSTALIVRVNDTIYINQPGDFSGITKRCGFLIRRNNHQCLDWRLEGITP